MSVKVMTYVWDNYTKGGTKKLLYLALADACNETGYCWPGIKTLSKRCNIGRRYVQKLLRELEDEGEIETRTQATSQQRTTSNRYTMKKYLSSRGEPQAAPTIDEGANPGSPIGANYSSPTGANPRPPEPLKEPSKKELTEQTQGVVDILSPTPDKADELKAIEILKRAGVPGDRAVAFCLLDISIIHACIADAQRAVESGRVTRIKQVGYLIGALQNQLKAQRDKQATTAPSAGREWVDDDYTVFYEPPHTDYFAGEYSMFIEGGPRASPAALSEMGRGT